MRSILFWSGLTVSLAICAPKAQAHMPWLATDGEGHAVLWFGESPENRTYKLPETIAQIQLHSGTSGQPLAASAVSTDELVGLRSDAKIESENEIAGTFVYGLYHGMKLTYHVEHLPQRLPKTWPEQPRKDAYLQTIVTPAERGGVDVTVLKQTKPVEGVSVKLFCEEGHEEGEATTDADGRVSFSKRQIESGLNALMLSLRNESDSGSLDGKPYSSSADYLTATFFVPEEDAAATSTREKKDSGPSVDPTSKVTVVSTKFAELPEELTSFGAAVAGKTLFVYGGHTGAAHSYSIEEQSNRLWSLDLADGNAEWKKRSTDLRLQGLALVPWNEGVVRIGGFTAMNEEGDDHDLRSQPTVAVFDPATDSWSERAPLPEPRSSFDAAVLGDSVYVVGGWQLQGTQGDTQWHDTAWSLDLTNKDAKWQALTVPEFQRRALSVAAFNEKLYVIGGMQSNGETTTRVDAYDPKTKTWSKAPSIPGEGMSGFGSAAYAVGENLYVSTMDGFVHRLRPNAEAWETVAKVDPARFFHRMIPHDGNLLMVGGANMRIGKFTDIEAIELND
ncbi:MAG: kelch repeat-containing protein [Planctomycetota bacterium]